MHIGPYQRDIMDQLHCTAEEAEIVEILMRDEIFHSTLDWQTEKEFQSGARKAWKLFLSDRDFFVSHHRKMKALFHEMKNASAQ